nr:MAG TPA: hypothetical protein [Caudoviricetes sp.]
MLAVLLSILYVNITILSNKTGPCANRNRQLFQLNVIHFSILYFFMNFCLPG